MRRLLPVVVLFAAVHVVEGGEIVVSAAASTRDALTEVAKLYEARTHQRVLLNFGGSNEMARQIAAGAPVDVFVAADEATMRRVTPRWKPLLANRLAIVSARRITPRQLPSVHRIAIANWTASVPAGVYWHQWLVAQKLWPSVERTLIPTIDVRAALAAFDTGAVDAALVYATDARLSKRAHATFVVAQGPRIVYPAAALTRAGGGFYAFLFSAEARKVFERYGFSLSS